MTASIGQLWEDFFAHTYSKVPMTPEQQREYRLLFYTGFNACINAFGALAEPGKSDEEQREIVRAYLNEYRAFAHAYIVDRVRDGQ